MRGEIPRIISLILILFLLSTTNVSAKPMPVIEGSVFNFEWIREKSCVEIYPYPAFDFKVGETDIKEMELYITDINYDDETIDYNILMDDGNWSISSTLSINRVGTLIHPRYWTTINDYEFLTVSNAVYYSSAVISSFIKPDFEEVNNLIRDSLYREDDNHLGEAIEVEFMGKNSIEKGAEKLDSDNRRWSIYLYFQDEVNNLLSDIKVWREWEYNRDGLLIFSKIRKDTKQVDADDWCSFEEIYKNTDSIFSSFYGTKVNISLFLLLIPLIIIYLWKKRKKISRIFLL